jgi:hypothetical protein
MNLQFNSFKQSLTRNLNNLYIFVFLLSFSLLYLNTGSLLFLIPFSLFYIIAVIFILLPTLSDKPPFSLLYLYVRYSYYLKPADRPHLPLSIDLLFYVSIFSTLLYSSILHGGYWSVVLSLGFVFIGIQDLSLYIRSKFTPLPPTISIDEIKSNYSQLIN